VCPAQVFLQQALGSQTEQGRLHVGELEGQLCRLEDAVVLLTDREAGWAAAGTCAEVPGRQAGWHRLLHCTALYCALTRMSCMHITCTTAQPPSCSVPISPCCATVAVTCRPHTLHLQQPLEAL
jgi:hypothetical protein